MSREAGTSKITAENLRIWCLLFLLCAAFAAYSFKYVDIPTSRFLIPIFGSLSSLGAGLSGVVLVSGEAAVVLLLIILRHMHGHLPKIAQLLAIACLTSICAYAINSTVLKILFGVPNPSDVFLNSMSHSFHWLNGSNNSSFPSGHMILASSWAGVFMFAYPKTRWFFSALLAFGIFLLVAGGWHFLSDVVIGTFCGVTVGLLAGELWLIHTAGQA